MLALIFNKDYPTGNWLTQKSWFQQIQQNFALKCQASKSFFFSMIGITLAEITSFTFKLNVGQVNHSAGNVFAQ